jgi:PAS domain S-box-containing protein
MRIERVGRGLCLAAGAVGLLALLGWAVGLLALTNIIPGQPAMRPLSAFATVLLSIASWCIAPKTATTGRRLCAYVLALVVMAIATVFLVEYATGRAVGIAEWRPFGFGRGPLGRPSPLATLALLLLGACVLVFDWRIKERARPSEWLALVGGLSALGGIVGHLFGAGPSYFARGTEIIGISLPTAIALLALAIGLLFLRADAGLMRIATSLGPGGVLFRRLVLPVVLLPIAVGLVILHFFRRWESDDVAAACAALAASTSVIGLALMPFTAVPLDRAHAATKLAQDRLEGIISTAADAIISVDSSQRITMFNEGAARVFGYSREEALGASLDILLPPHVRNEHRRDVSAFAAEPVGARKMGENRRVFGLRKDGSQFPADAAISRLQVNGDMTYTAVVRDMTDSVALEAKLRDARGFLESVLESSVEHSVIAIDLQRRVVLWTAGAQRTFGYGKEDVLGLPVDLLFRPEERESGAIAALFEKALEQPSATAILVQQRKDGSQLLGRSVVSRRTGADGATDGFVIVTRDITDEHRRAEHERVLAELAGPLTSSLDRTVILNNVGAIVVRELADVCILDLFEQPGDTGFVRRSRITCRDPSNAPRWQRLEDMSVDPRRASLGRSSLATKQASVLTHVTSEYLDGLAQSKEHGALLRELGPVSTLSVPLPAHGAFIGSMTLVSTDRNHRYSQEDVAFVQTIGDRLAAALENARLFEVAETAIAARNDVLRVVAHDLRNPLATALLAAELLSRPQDERRRNTVRITDRILRALGRANDMIEDLLDVTRLESGGLAILPAARDIARIASEAVEMHASAASAAQIELTSHLEHELPLAWVDEARVLQVLGNLIGNALKFTPAGGHIDVRVSRKGGEIEVCVADTGQGIAPEHLAHVFERFWQAQKADRRGAGLGLPIAKGIVEAHHGRIWIESEVGRGTRILFTLPIAPAAPRGQLDARTQPHA